MKPKYFEGASSRKGTGGSETIYDLSKKKDIDIRKVLVVLIKYLGHPDIRELILQNRNIDTINQLMLDAFWIISNQTPRSFLHIFPVIEKSIRTRDGLFISGIYGYALDDYIGEMAQEFLLGYENRDVLHFMQNYLCLVRTVWVPEKPEKKSGETCGIVIV